MALFIPSIINDDWVRLHGLLAVLVVLYTFVFLSALIDLYFGIRRARRLKVVCTSFGFRRTITKLSSYFGLLLMFTFADVAASIVLKMPYFTVIGTIGIIIVEVKSVFENVRNEEKNVEDVKKELEKLLERLEDFESKRQKINRVLDKRLIEF